MNVQLTIETYGGLPFKTLGELLQRVIEKDAPDDAQVSTDGDDIVIEWDE